MNIKIHRGTHEIGGTCIQISTKTTNILLDAGLPLKQDSIPVDLSKINFEAVLLSHSHLDHYGLLDGSDKPVPVYSGELSQRFIEAAYIFTGRELPQINFRNIKSRESFSIGDIKITPYLVDHSAADAYAFLIESGGKRLFYSGDFRAHGRKGKLFEYMIKNTPEELKNPDALIIEGTMLSRTDEKRFDEKNVEEEMYNIIRQETGLCFLLCSGQNIDRLVSAYRAAVRSGRIFVVDIYTAWILNQISDFSNNVPNIKWEKVKVLSRGGTAASHYVKVKNNRDYFGNFVFSLYSRNSVITHEELKNSPQNYLIKNEYVKTLLIETGCEHSSVIYSKWKGYLKKEHNIRGYRRLQKLQEDPQIDFVPIHSSGHAYTSDLQKFVKALKPGRVIPVHTECGEMYKEFFDNVCELEDGEEIEV